MVRRDPDRTRGLPALEESRQQRRRALVLGKVRVREAAPQFWLWTAVGLLAFSVVYWHYSERELVSQKSAVMARQRAIAKGLEPELLPLRERIERSVVELAGDWAEELIDEKLSLEELSKSKGLYLRMLRDSVGPGPSIAKAAQSSFHDGFTSCLFEREERISPEQGTKCFSTSQCPDGELCNEWGICAPPSQPFNLRTMYAVFRVLSSDWTDELHAATSDYQVRLFERDLDKVVRTDVKITTDVIASARYFTVLLDEMPKDGIPPHPEGADAGVLGRPELRVQGYDHVARLGIWDLRDDKLLVRAKFSVGADFIPMGRVKTAPQSVLDAQQRQVNNCGIAASLRRRLERARAQQVGAAPTAAAPTKTAPTAGGDGSAAPSPNAASAAPAPSAAPTSTSANDPMAPSQPTAPAPGSTFGKEPAAQPKPE